MSSLVLILLSATLINISALGAPPRWRPFSGVIDIYRGAQALALAALIALPAVSMANWALTTLLLAPFGLEYLRTFAFVVVLLLITYAIEAGLRRFTRLEPQRPGFPFVMITNAAALGAALLIEARGAGFATSLVLALIAAIAFAGLLLAFASMYERVRAADVPTPFREAPLALITVGLMALALLGFTGLVQE